ncbi:MAG: hypothetical protein R3B59_02365 [Dehalococcoidia bacterium]
MHDDSRLVGALGRLTRRRFLSLTGSGLAGGVVLAACGDDDDEPSPTVAAGTGTATATVATSGGAAATGTAAAAGGSGPLTGTVLVGDVVGHALRSDRWQGDFGFVTFKLHEGLVDDEPAYFIRTDASDRAFATVEKLVYVPKMAAALRSGAGLSAIYLFEGGASGQTPVLSSAPHMADFSPAFRVHRVTFTGPPTTLGSVAAIEAAETAGTLRVEQTDIVVNYPVVKWPGGELPADSARTAYLGDGQLIEPVDVAGMEVTFKLHSCYPGTRYIVTDVTLPPMAGGMNIAPAGGAGPLTDAGATAQILVFGNGVKGSGPMGFQKSVTDTNVGDPAWSPFWDHYTFLWENETSASVLKSPGDLVSRESSGALKRFPGTPDTNGTLFMVNCPAPVSAPVA